jgi:hypothetical protein
VGARAHGEPPCMRPRRVVRRALRDGDAAARQAARWQRPRARAAHCCRTLLLHTAAATAAAHCRRRRAPAQVTDAGRIFVRLAARVSEGEVGFGSEAVGLPATSIRQQAIRCAHVCACVCMCVCVCVCVCVYVCTCVCCGVHVCAAWLAAPSHRQHTHAPKHKCTHPRTPTHTPAPRRPTNRPHTRSPPAPTRTGASRSARSRRATRARRCTTTGSSSARRSWAAAAQSTGRTQSMAGCCSRCGLCVGVCMWGGAVALRVARRWWCMFCVERGRLCNFP